MVGFMRDPRGRLNSDIQEFIKIRQQTDFKATLKSFRVNPSDYRFVPKPSEAKPRLRRTHDFWLLIWGRSVGRETVR